MLSVPSHEHCGQYGGVGSRDCVRVRVVVQLAALCSSAVARFAPRRARKRTALVDGMAIAMVGKKSAENYIKYFKSNKKVLLLLLFLPLW